jgi:hypothetical protein
MQGVFNFSELSILKNIRLKKIYNNKTKKLQK